MATSSASEAKLERTEDQEKNFRRLVEDAAKHAAAVALKKVKADRAGWQNTLENGRKLHETLTDALVRKVTELSFLYGNQLVAWKNFYQKHFGLELDFSSLQVPEHREGFDRLIIVAKELANDGKPINLVYDACARQFPCFRSHDDLDTVIPENDRDPKNGTYAIWVRDRQEADEENKNLSANDLQKRGIQGTTVLEGELYELKFFDETGKHLDIKNVSLHTGSRGRHGSVPFVDWFGVRFCVLAHWCDPGRALGNLRARSAVSLPAEPRVSAAKQA